ncbi:glycoside hydrolase family 25 protein [uncultured Ruminococcus sp.]|uniref:glycoside hydrolase family 25 protein n=1 Tax=uncultured Ruminococcus sp. TaxID=165186 RepID=UPI000EE360FA|nr:glycoside hydrolase family 25 protein [uncultured Ruminococcus sp.]HCJ41821.1 glycoside hydrolase [Ruminococcus sp.]
MTIKGIDVSQWQGDIDFNKVKASGIDFVILRAGYGRYISQKDPYFEQNYARAKSAGLKVGAYWYSYADSEADARTEAAICMETIKGKQFEYPIYFDLEEQSQFSRGKAFCSALVTAFCGELEKAGYFAGLYISRSPLQNYITAEVAGRYALWIAEYGSKCNYGGAYGMWQYSSEGRVNGISGAVDMDECYVDYPTIIKAGGFNGYTKTDVHCLDISGFQKGDKSIGVLALKELLRLAREKGLTSAGFDVSHCGFYDGTEKAVNEILVRWGYKANGIAGENFIKRLGDALSVS